MTETRLLHTILAERITELQVRSQDPERYRPFSTGIGDLNRILFGGLPRDPFYFILTGDKKVGKSTVELNLALNFCTLSNEPTALYILEEVSRQIADRSLARASKRVSRSRIFNLDLNDEDFEDMQTTRSEYESVPFYVNDTLFNQNDIIADAKALGITRIVVDNFQLMTGGKGGTEREILVNQSKRFMRERKNGLTTFLVSQENVKGKAFGSSQMDMDGDITIGIRRVLVDETNKKSGYMQNMRRLQVLYSRFSQGDMACDVFFEGNHSRILQIEPKLPDHPDFIELLDEHQPPDDIDD